MAGARPQRAPAGISPRHGAPPARVAGAARSLAPLGEVTRAELLGLSERGGMQVAVVRLTTGARTVTALMYRSPGGAIEEYLLW